jgi:shikimate dehydrogenase
VLGSPIAHSKSPAIHRAAYGVLGLDWSYKAIEMTGDRLAEFVAGCGPEWRGLSLTMPLKRDILPLLNSRDGLVDVVGGANTVRFTEGGLAGFNTDVYGVVQSLRDAGLETVHTARVLGAGATAASVIAALAELGAEIVTVTARVPAKAESLIALGNALGVAVVARAYDWQDTDEPDVIISTVPGGVGVPVFPAAVRAHAVLLDVAYDPWPSALALAWGEVGGRVVSGLDMLVHQAIGQIRVFLGGDRITPLPEEPRVLAAMRAAVAL